MAIRTCFNLRIILKYICHTITFSCFDAQLFYPLTYGRALFHTVLIVSAILTKVGSDKMSNHALYSLNDVGPSLDELAK